MHTVHLPKVISNIQFKTRSLPVTIETSLPVSKGRPNTWLLESPCPITDYEQINMEISTITKNLLSFERLYLSAVGGHICLEFKNFNKCTANLTENDRVLSFLKS